MRASFFVLVVALGCGSSVDSGASGAAGNGSASATSSGSGGTTGTSAGGAGGGFATVTTSGSGGSPMECPIVLDEDTYYFDVSGDGPSYLLAAACPGFVYASAQYGIGGECGPAGLELRACGDRQAGLFLSAYGASMPGTFADGEATYTRSDGAAFSGSDPTIVLEELGEVGSAARGTFETTVHSVDSNESLALSGSFVLCRVPDQPPCP